MQNSSVISIIKSFSKEELSRFEDFIHSPYFNKSTKVIELFYYLKKFRPEYDSDKLDKENVFKALYKGKEFNYGLFKNLIYDLNKLCERFLTVENFSSKQSEQLINLLEELTKRELNVPSEKNFKALEKILNDPEFDSSLSSLLKFKSDSLKMDFMFRKSGNKLFLKDELWNISKMKEENLNKFFFLETIDIYNYLLSYMSMRKKEPDLKFRQNILNHLNSLHLPDYPEVILNVYNLKLRLNENDEENYLKAKELIITYKDFLISNKDIAYNFFSSLAAFCRPMMLRTDERKYLNEMHYLFKKMFEYETLTNINFYPVNIFRSALNVALRLKEFEWAENFFNENIGKLSPEVKDIASNVYLSLLNFEKGNYEKSLECLSVLEAADDLNKMIIKYLQIKNNYELERFSLLEDSISAYKQFLMHNKNIGTLELTAAKNFLKFTDRLVRFNFKYNKKDIELLIDEIKKTDCLSNRMWLGAKAKALL